MTHFKRKAITAVGVVVTSSALMAPPVSADPPPDVTFAVASVNGGGCELDSLTASQPASEFTVRYRDYHAWGGGGSKPADWLKNCQVVVQANTPEGFTYAVTGVDYRGYAEDAVGARGLMKASYHFQDVTPNDPVSHLVTGPFAASWSVSSEVPESSLIYKPCGEDRLLYLDSQLQVDAGQPSYIAMDTGFDPASATTFHIGWKTC